MNDSRSLLRKLVSRDGFEARLNARGQRHSVWIGPLTTRQQREWNRHLEEMLSAFKGGSTVDPNSLKFFETVPQRIREKLEGWGMLPPSKRRAVSPEQRTVGGWTQLCIDELNGAWRTKDNYSQARTWLLKFVSSDKDIASVTVGELKRWQASMSTSLGVTTRNKHLKRVKTMFKLAVEDGLISDSPANAVKLEREERVDRSRQYFVDASKTQRVMDSLPNTNWKLVFALMRFQGLRRHEVFAIDWHNIDWTRSELTVPAVTTSGAKTKTGQRTMPIFPEVMDLLRDQREIVATGAKVVQWTGTEESLSELLRKRVEKVLGQCWPKPCHQLRSTRRTELDREFPRHVVNEWLGHSSEVAEKHYQQITSEDLTKAHGLTTMRTTAGTPEPLSNDQKEQVTDRETSITSGEYADSLSSVGGSPGLRQPWKSLHFQGFFV